MFTSLSPRLLRGPRTYIPIFFALLFLAFILGGFGSSRHYPLSFTSFSSAESLYYSKGEPRQYIWKTHSFFPPLNDPTTKDFCEGFPREKLDRIQIIVKTGVGEPAKNIAHLSTVTSCITNVLFFSDVEETINGQRFIDILADLPPSYSVDNPDWTTYITQKKAHSKGEISYSKEGWRLDRFKFLPMIERAYKMRPKADWYVFIETDVYYFWDTLFRQLSQLDPFSMHYMGSPAPGGQGLFFAYGGAGFVISRGLMERLVGNDSSKTLSVQYESQVKKDCCGDSVLGYAIKERTGVRLEALYPTFAGDELSGLRVNEEWWCVPLLALHRVSPEQQKSLWEWERTRPYNTKPFTLSSILAYTHSNLRDSPTREFWDNLASDIQPKDSPAHASVLACSTACKADEKCLQYTFTDKTCRFGSYIMMGRPVGTNLKFTSGWDVEKMKKLGFKVDGDFSDSCSDATWLKANIR